MLIVDVTGHEAEAQALRDKITKNMQAQGDNSSATQKRHQPQSLGPLPGDTKDQHAANFLKKFFVGAD